MSSTGGRIRDIARVCRQYLELDPSVTDALDGEHVANGRGRFAGSFT
ncbi:hypothetical protein [Streptomyces achromogenes]